jgi:hypothetical protein
MICPDNSHTTLDSPAANRAVPPGPLRELLSVCSAIHVLRRVVNRTELGMVLADTRRGRGEKIVRQSGESQVSDQGSDQPPLHTALRPCSRAAVSPWTLRVSRT